MSLRDGTAKMSKSDPSDMSRVNLTDSDDTIAQKIRKAKTDPEPLPTDAAGLKAGRKRKNLVGIYGAVTARAWRGARPVRRPGLRSVQAGRSPMRSSRLIAPIRERLEQLRER